MPSLEMTCPEGADTEIGANRDGSYRVSWKGADGADVQLVETGPLGEQVIYLGPEDASTITGRPQGDYQYSVAVVGQPESSAECTVKVRPYSLSLALGFFAVGLAVTVLTIGVILRGHRAHRRGELG
jgi:hypothetical protein